jgi:hypothetical protein
MKIAAWFGAMTMALGAACQATPIVSVASFSAPVLDLKEPMLPTGSADFAKSVMDEMVAASQDVRSGISPDAAVGHYVIVVVKLPTGDPQGLQKGRQSAMKQIAEYLGAQIEGSTESGYKEKTGSDDKSESSSFFSDYSAVRVNQTLGAVDTIGLATHDGRTFAGFILSEGAARRMQKISAQSEDAARKKAEGKPLEVEASGIALIENNNEATAKQSATESAKRTAIEMAMGATVIGLSVMDRDDSTETFRQTCFSNTEGNLERYEILSEGRDGNSYKVRIRGTINPGKLLENYRAHLRSIGDPVFCIDACGDPNIQAAANAFFQEKGFRVQEGAGCTWTIRMKPTFVQREDPQDNSKNGFQCLIDAQLVNVRSGEVFANAGATAKGFSSMNGASDVQRRKSADLAFKNMKSELHKKIEGTILRLAREGRPVTIEVQGIGTVDGVTTKLQEALALRPGINDALVSLRDGTVTIKLKALVQNDLVAKFVGVDACAMATANSRAVLRQQDDEKIVLEIQEVAK